MRSDKKKADEFYLEARDEVLAAVAALPKRVKSVRTSDGTRIRIQRKTPLRIYLLMIYRYAAGQAAPTAYNFQRGGRVDLGGDRRVPMREALARGHDPWASRQELLDLADEIRRGEPE